MGQESIQMDGEKHSPSDIIEELRKQFLQQVNRVVLLDKQGYQIHTSNDPQLEGYDEVATVGGNFYIFWKPQPRRINGNGTTAKEDSSKEAGREVTEGKGMDV